MNLPTVKTVVMEPAKVEFNFDELSAMLDKQLEKYKGLEFTEKKVKELKETITELNKGKKSLSDYRIATKKELSVSIADFEHECKQLSNKFDSVIAPLKEQADEFEETRRNEKREKVQLIVDELLDKEGLNERFAAELIIEDSYLNKSTTLKSIREDLETKAHHLGVQQDKEDSDKEIIKMTVDIANERYGVELLDSTYIRLLEYEDINNIKSVITEDAHDELDKKLEAEEPKKEFKQIPISSAPSSISIDEELFREVYKVTATESQLDALEEFMNREEIDWVAIEE